jgi:hypothetical protein
VAQAVLDRFWIKAPSSINAGASAVDGWRRDFG